MSDFERRRWFQGLSRMHNGEMFPDLQREIAMWAQQAFGEVPEQSIFEKIKAEIGELGWERYQYWLDTDKGRLLDKGDTAAIAAESADVLIMLFQLAEFYEIDLLDETRKKFEVNKQRTWEMQPDGTYQHREEPRND